MAPGQKYDGARALEFRPALSSPDLDAVLSERPIVDVKSEPPDSASRWTPLHA